ncbi:hypothetical protein V1264_000020 [Littorina saxatilis]|uniref:Uncharacterized protein n=1 Tax=Littorina saxatilis TaxID=31220 RepID=A0AAN9BXX3_9CAEN
MYITNCVTDNHAGDSGLEGLVTALGDLQGLTVLNLAGNNITATGLRTFAALFNTQPHNTDPPLPLLESLDLSHNPLGSNIADSLCHIVKGLPSLTSLSLSSCHLTAALFQHNRPALAASLQGSRLQHLDVSHNNLGTLGVELLLRSVNSHTITALDLGHTRSDPSPGHLIRHLRAFIRQGCALRDLSLENCCIHQEDLEFLCRLPIELPGLQRLNISVNKAVTTDTVQRLLSNSAHCPDSHLHRLEAQSCSVTSPLSLPSSSSPTLMESLKDKLTAPHALQHLALTCGRLDKADKEALTEAWTQRWVEVSVQFCGQSVLLALKQPG